MSDPRKRIPKQEEASARQYPQSDSSYNSYYVGFMHSDTPEGKAEKKEDIDEKYRARRDAKRKARNR